MPDPARPDLKETSCQLQEIRGIESGNSRLNDVLQTRVRVLRNLKRIVLYLVNTFRRFVRPRGAPGQPVPQRLELNPGDRVRVRSRAEIDSTLNAWGEYRGCRFIDEMYDYCGKSFTVLKQVDFFFDEVSRKICRCQDTFLLRDAICSGRQRLYTVSCDRNCFFFWKSAWLTKIDASSVPGSPGSSAR